MRDRMICKLACAVFFFMPMAQVAGAEILDGRSAITSQLVAAAMASSGMAVAAAQVEFLTPVSASDQAPGLKVVSVASGTSGAANVKLRCRDNRECLPFYVRVHGLNVTGLQTDPLEGTHAQSLVVRRAPKQRVVRGGDPATLILESADMRINLPVICLENGVFGQKIRVASTDRKQFFEARVVEAGMLKGSL